MNVQMKPSRRITSALLLSLALAGCASGPGAPSAELTQRIESARTRSDHQALASEYEREAAAARAMAEKHRKMAKSYQGMLAGGRGAGNMAAHCNVIVRSQEAIATEYEGMATAHRQLAAQAPS